MLFVRVLSILECIIDVGIVIYVLPVFVFVVFVRKGEGRCWVFVGVYRGRPVLSHRRPVLARSPLFCHYVVFGLCVV